MSLRTFPLRLFSSGGWRLLFWLLLVSPLFGGCVSQRARKGVDARVLWLRKAAELEMPALCDKIPARRFRLVLFVSRHCAPCHKVIRSLRPYERRLKQRGVQPVLLWVDASHCVQAKWAGAHVPAWPAGLADAVSQQEWRVSATPVLYLLDGRRPLLRIDGVLSGEVLFQILKKKLRSGKTP